MYGRLAATEQDEDQATYAPKIKNADAELDWRLPAVQLARAVRAYAPAPGAWFMLGKERIKCWRASVQKGIEGPAGKILVADGTGVTIACGEGGLRLESLQRPGKRRITGGEFAAQLELVGQQL